MATPILCSNPSLQFLAQKQEITDSILRVINSDSYILGSEVSSFEEEFAAYVGVTECIGVNSGTDSIILGLKALGITCGDEVITPSHTAVATVAAIVASGATPVFADIDPISFTLDPNSVREAITTNTKAIIAVHLYGHPCDMDSLMQLSNDHGLFLIEDCSQAHGAKWRNRNVGTFGILACFSFYPTKNLGAIGDGGAVVTNNLDLANLIRQLRQYGWDSQRQAQVQSQVSRLDEIQAAILRVKLVKLDLANSKRRNIAASYYSRLQHVDLQLPTSNSMQVRAGEIALETEKYLIQIEEGMQYWIRLLNEKVIPIEWPTQLELVSKGDLGGGIQQIYGDLNWMQSESYVKILESNYLDNACNEILDGLLTSEIIASEVSE